MTLDLKVEMHELKGETRPQNIYTYLSPGAQLSFTKNAIVSNQYSIDHQMKMYVFLNGGSIDMSELSTEEKSLIVIIDNKQNRSESNWTIFPVPVTTKLSFINAKSEKANKISIYNSAGQKVNEENHPSEIDVSIFVPGVYYLVIHSGNYSESFKFIKQ